MAIPNAGKNVEWERHSGKQYGSFLKSKEVCIMIALNQQLQLWWRSLGLHHREIQTYFQTKPLYEYSLLFYWKEFLTGNNLNVLQQVNVQRGCGTSMLRNISDKRTEFWHMQQHGRFFTELNWVNNIVPKYHTVYNSVYITLLK